MFLSIKRAFYIVCMCVHTCACSVLYCVYVCAHVYLQHFIYIRVYVCAHVCLQHFILCVCESVCVHMCACSVEFFGAGATGVCKQPNMDARI